MPLQPEHDKQEKKLTLNITNGAYQQIEELQRIYKLKDIADVVELGINILELGKNKKILLQDSEGGVQKIKVTEEE
jgi:hypothetical protein